MKYCVFSSCILLHPTYFHMPHFFSWPLEMPFCFSLIQPPSAQIKNSFGCNRATDPLQHCDSWQGPCSCCLRAGVGWEGYSWMVFCGLLCNSQSLQFPLPSHICEAPVDITKNFTLQVRERCLPKDMLFCHAAVAPSMMWSKVKTFHCFGDTFSQAVPPCDFLEFSSSVKFASDLFLPPKRIMTPAFLLW